MDRHEWNERYSAREQTFLREPSRLVVAEVEGLPAGVALDVATGEGRHAVWLAGLGWRVVGVDFAEVGLRRAQRRAWEEGLNDRASWALADVHRLRLPPSRFDLVLLSFFHPRPPDRTSVYEAVARTLAPGGSLVQISYDKLHAVEGVGGPRDPEILVDTAAVAAELASLGLEVQRADTVRLTSVGAEGEEIPVVDSIIHAVKPG